jgi:hypothetical protein
VTPRSRFGQKEGFSEVIFKGPIAEEIPLEAKALRIYRAVLMERNTAGRTRIGCN